MCWKNNREVRALVWDEAEGGRGEEFKRERLVT